MKPVLFAIALSLGAFATARTAIASYSGGLSTCGGTIEITGTAQGNSWRIVCSGDCYEAVLGWGTCMLFQSGQIAYDHDSDPLTPDLVQDTYSCGCRFANPIDPETYIFLLDTTTVQSQVLPDCDALGLVGVGQSPGAGGTVAGGMCGVVCDDPLEWCRSSDPLDQTIPDGTTVTRTCDCRE